MPNLLLGAIWSAILSIFLLLLSVAQNKSIREFMSNASNTVESIQKFGSNIGKGISLKPLLPSSRDIGRTIADAQREADNASFRANFGKNMIQIRRPEEQRSLLPRFQIAEPVVDATGATPKQDVHMFFQTLRCNRSLLLRSLLFYATGEYQRAAVELDMDVKARRWLNCLVFRQRTFAESPIDGKREAASYFLKTLLLGRQ
jgi:hypothetical protein